ADVDVAGPLDERPDVAVALAAEGAVGVARPAGTAAGRPAPASSRARVFRRHAISFVSAARTGKRSGWLVRSFAVGSVPSESVEVVGSQPLGSHPGWDCTFPRKLKQGVMAARGRECRPAAGRRPGGAGLPLRPGARGRAGQVRTALPLPASSARPASSGGA